MTAAHAEIISSGHLARVAAFFKIDHAADYCAYTAFVARLLMHFQ
jgi:hypothetical protein